MVYVNTVVYEPVKYHTLLVYMIMNLRGLAASILIVSLLASILVIGNEPRVASVEFSNGGLSVRFNARSSLLNLTSRSMIFNYVQGNPGTHLRGICSALSISLGSAQYHLDRLVDGELLESERDSKYKRFFVTRRFSQIEKRVIALMKRPTTKRIMTRILSEGRINHQALASSVGVTSQAISWQVKLLSGQGIIESFEQKGVTCYGLSYETRQVLEFMDIEGM